MQLEYIMFLVLFFIVAHGFQIALPSARFRTFQNYNPLDLSEKIENADDATHLSAINSQEPVVRNEVSALHKKIESLQQAIASTAIILDDLKSEATQLQRMFDEQKNHYQEQVSSLSMQLHQSQAKCLEVTTKLDQANKDLEFEKMRNKETNEVSLLTQNDETAEE